MLFAALLAMGLTVLLIPPLMHWSGKLGVLDQPGGRRTHAKPIPRVGGMAMAAGMLLSILVWGEQSSQLHAYVLATCVLLVFGVQDDRLELSPKWKLLGQVLAALIVMYVGQVQIGVVRDADMHELPVWLSAPVTLLFIVGVTNAINLADGLDGLAGGATLLCLSGLLLLALTGGSMQVAFVCVLTMGALLGFLRYNTHPARIFMGDAGSQLLGFTAAVLSLLLTQDRSLPFSAALPLLLLGVPVIDTLTVMTERVLDGKSPFQADRNHVHHRLLALGFDHHEAVMVVYSAQTLLLVLAWYLRFASDVLIVLVFMAVAAGIVTLLRQARQRHWRWRSQGVAPVQQSWLRLQLRWLRQDDRLHRWSGYGIGITIISYALALIFNGLSASTDIRWLSVLAALGLATSSIMHRAGKEVGWLSRAALYVCALIAVSMDRAGSMDDDVRCLLEAVIFITLAICIAIRLYLSSDRRYQLTPLDVLVLLVAVALPNLPGSIISNYATGWVVAKALLLLYGIENLAVSTGIQWRILTGSAVVFLATVAMSAG